MTQTEAAPTQDPEEVQSHAPESHEDDHHDPLHDIDAKKTIYSVLGTLGGVVFLMWAMTHLFNLLVQVERQTKIGDIPATELQQIRGDAMDELAGKKPGRGTMTIDEAIAKYIKK